MAHFGFVTHNLDALVGRLQDAGFFFAAEKAPGMRVNLRNLWSRMPLTRADAQMMHGVLRQVVRWADREK